MEKTKSIGSSQLKERREEHLSKLKLRWRLFKSKYSSVSGYKRLIVKIAMYLLLLGLAFVFIYPFIYMIVTSLKSDADLNSLSVQWIPTELKFENYFVAIDILKAGRYLKNSLFVTVVASIGHIISCSFIGYGFARFHFPFKKLLFGCVILAFIVPVQTLIIPMYLTYSNLGWLDSYLPLIVPTFFGFGLKGALYVFLFRQFYLTLPRDLENAARIDGCGFLMTYWKIVFPLAQSTLMVALVLSVVWHWNDFYEPAIFVSKARLGFLPPRLNSIVAAVNALPEQMMELLASLGLQDGEDTLNNAVVMSGATLISAPVLVFFAFAQRKFMQGIERTGITGE